MEKTELTPFVAKLPTMEAVVTVTTRSDGLSIVFDKQLRINEGSGEIHLKDHIDVSTASMLGKTTYGYGIISKACPFGDSYAYVAYHVKTTRKKSTLLLVMTEYSKKKGKLSVVNETRKELGVPK